MKIKTAICILMVMALVLTACSGSSDNGNGQNNNNVTVTGTQTDPGTSDNDPNGKEPDAGPDVPGGEPVVLTVPAPGFAGSEVASEIFVAPIAGISDDF